MSDPVILTIGFIAQALFASRIIVQWIKSEKSGSVASPVAFWLLSLMASFLMLTYGILRKDFVIFLGQVLSYFIYIRNLQFKNTWTRIPLVLRLLFIVFPLATGVFLLSSGSHGLAQILSNPEIPISLLVWGSIGQIIFTLRFLYQWIQSEKIKQSILPLGFWVISAVGSIIVLSYAFYRMDPVLLLGQAVGLTIYLRNIFLHKRSSLIGITES